MLPRLFAAQCVCAAVLAAGVSVASGQPRMPALPRLAIEDSGNGEAMRMVASARPSPFPVAVRAVVDLQNGNLDQSLARFSTNQDIPLWIAISAPSSREGIDSWRRSLRDLLDRTSGALVILEVMSDRQPADVVRFATQLAATEVRARRDGIQVALGGPAIDDEARRAATYSSETAPYVDLLAVSDGAGASTVAWMERNAPGAGVLVTGRQVRDGESLSQALIVGVVTGVGTSIAAESWPAQALSVPALRALAPLAGLVTHEVTALDPEAVGLSLQVGGVPPPAGLHHRLLFDTESFSTLLAYWGGPSGPPLSISLRVPLAGTVASMDLLTGARATASSYTRDEATERVSVAAPLTGNPMLVDFNEGAVLAGAPSSVSAERQLTVGEIVSRHRRQQLTQDRLVKSYIADARVREFFRPTLTDAGYDVVTENRYYVAEDGIEWERLSFSVNNRGLPTDMPYPLLQPEKMFALPLQLRFDEGYTYRLTGTTRIGDFDCYEVQFEPIRDDPSLYRGTVWIDRRTFARIRVHAVQGGLAGMVISNDETQHYAPEVVGNQPVFLLRELEGRQIALLAGRNITIEKQVGFSGFRINDGRFEEERAAVRSSDRIMFKETANGLRPYVKRDGVREVVEQPTQSVKAMAFGVVIDPSYQFPLPIFGINYVDFALGGDDRTQMAMLFAGVLAAGNIQRPQLFGARNLHGSLDFFAIAAPSSDRVYSRDGELEGERLLTWPLSTGINVGWQATPFQKLSVQYQFRFDAYVHDTTTSETFETPSSTLTNGVGVGWDYSRGGYSVGVNAAWFARAGWKPWGEQSDGALETTSGSYAKYSASVSRDVFIDIFQKLNVNAAWFGGERLDRFVRYQFGLFDTTRIHGVPASVRFGELALVRGSYSLNLLNQYRIDVFLEHGWGRDGRGEDWQNVPGVGGAFNLPGPWNTIIRADVGQSWLPERYSTLGSTVVQVMMLKPLR